jgi:hypothetical protein
MKRKTLGIAVAIAIGALSTSAFAVSPYGNATQKGSLLIFPKVNNSTFIQITNDFSGDVQLKCYYQTNEGPNGIFPAASSPSPYTKKHRTDFQFPITKNQTVWWWANGEGGGLGVPNLFPMADGYTGVGADLKCWAVNATGDREIHFNHLVGTATVVDGGSAYTYNAYHFQAVTPSNASENTNTPLPSAGTLNLDGAEYDLCSRQVIGNINAVTAAFGPSAYSAQVDLIQCNQDLRETYTPPVTKYVFEFWSENEIRFTGTEVCGDSWVEIDLWNLPHARRTNLKTDKAYFRGTGVGQVCPNAKDVGLMGILAQRIGNGALVGSTLNGRGSIAGKIYYDVNASNNGGLPGDEVKQ